MKKLLFTLSAVFLFLTSQAQWNAQVSTALGSVTGIHFIDLNQGFAVTKTDSILHTTNGGLTWSPVYAAANPLYAVHCADALNIYACGANGSFYSSTDGGATWLQNSTGQGYNLYGMHWINKDTGSAVGFNGTIIRTYSGGSFWSGQTSGTINNLNAVFFTDLLTGYAVGDLGTALKTIDGGSTWTAMTTGSGANLTSIFFTDANNGYIAGQGGNILKTTDAGATWNSMPSQTVNDLLSVNFTDANHGYACGKVGTILKTNDAGYTWYTQISGVSADLNSIFFLDINTGFASGTGGTILHTANGGCSGTYSVSITGADTACSGNSVTLNAAGGLTYTWSTTQQGSVMTDYPSTTTTYTLTGTVTDGCTANSVLTVTVYPYPSIYTTPNDVTCYGQYNGSTGATGSCISYTWQPGNIVAANISNLSAGVYTVTGTDVHGCLATVTSFINQPASPLSVTTANQVNVTCSNMSNGSVDGTASGGTAPYMYQWSSGSSSASNTNLAAGAYTVVATDSYGCKDSSIANISYTYQSPAPSVNGLSSLCPGQASQYVYVNSAGTSPFTVSWYDYSQATTFCINDTALFTPVTPGQDSLLLILTDAMGCVGKTTFTLAVGISDSLSGMITEPNTSPLTAGSVYLFRQQATHAGLFDTLGTVGIVNGVYSFPQLGYGDYFLKAIANAQTYPNAIATYYSNKSYPFQWDSALVVNHHTCAGANISTYSISVLEITPLSGPGVISGYVTAGPGYGQRLGVGGHVMGAPLKGIDVKLGRNPGGSPAARTTTDSITGQYVFSSIPLDQAFTIYVDIPNYGMDSTLTVTLTSGNTLSNNNDYYVDSLMVRVDVNGTTGIISVLNAAGGDINVYPNPASDNMCVENGSDKTEAILLNAFGTEMKKETLKSGKACFDSNSLPAGIYFIRIQTQHGIVTRKVLVQH